MCVYGKRMETGNCPFLGDMKAKSRMNNGIMWVALLSVMRALIPGNKLTYVPRRALDG